MNPPTIGQLIAPNAVVDRDAIHVAVLPAVAGDELIAGEDVGINAEGLATGSAHAIGVVDPFLHDAVKVGERFWIFIFPGAVTGLRHNWSHPLIDSGVVLDKPQNEKKPPWDDEDLIPFYEDDFCCDDES